MTAINTTVNKIANKIRKDSTLTEDQRQQELALVNKIRAGLRSGEFEFKQDRIDTIRQAAEKVQGSKNMNLRSKTKASSRKVRRAAAEETRGAEIAPGLGTDAFDYQIMGSNDSEARSVASSEGIEDAYNQTVRFDSEWN